MAVLKSPKNVKNKHKWYAKIRNQFKTTPARFLTLTRHHADDVVDKQF